MSECRSLGRNYYPYSQTRKISIGIIPDSLVKRSLGVTEGNTSAVPIAERVSSVIKEKNNGETLSHPGEKQTKTKKHFSSPWVTIRSVHEKLPAPEMVFPINSSNFFGNITKEKQHRVVQDVAATPSVQSFENPTLNLPNAESCRKKFDGAACSRAGQTGGSQREEEFTFTNAQEVFGLRKPQLERKTDKPENGRTETLKMKLWEILGTVSSPNKQQSDTGAAEVGDHNLKSGNAVDCMVDATVKPGQNSDTIEVDSESPDHTIKRPVTRALARKQAKSKKHAEEANTKYSKQQDKGITFSFHEGRPKKQAGASTIKSGASVPQRTRVRRKDSSVEPRKMLFYDKVDADKVEKTAYRGDRQPLGEKTSSFGNGLGSFHDCFWENTREKSQSATKKLKKVDRDKSPADRNLQEAFNTSLENIIGEQDVFRSSTFRAKTPVSAPSGSSTPKTDKMGKGAQSPATSGERSTHGNAPTFKHSQSANNKRKMVDLDKSPENVDQQEVFVNTSLEDILGGGADFQSPTFGIKTPIITTSAGSTPITNPMEKGAYSRETSGEKVNKGNIPSSKHLQSPRPDSPTSSSETEPPDDAGKFPDYQPRNLIARDEKSDAVHKFNESSSEEKESESNDEASPVTREYNWKFPDYQPRNLTTRDEKSDAEHKFNESSSEEKESESKDEASPVTREYNWKFPDYQPQNLTARDEKSDAEHKFNESSSEEKESESNDEASPVTREYNWKFPDYQPRNLTARDKKSDTEHKFNESSSEEKESESNDEASPVTREYNCETENIIFPMTAEEPEYLFHPTKRTRSCKENREDYWSQGFLELNQDNDLTRVVKLFVLVIERIRRKMNSATRKKSQEVMLSISEEIKSQLQNAESQIQTDILKVTSISKAKRKSLEKRCQEQQEQMKLIHERFKDQIDHHLQDCRNTVEELEAHQADFKGMVKKQKAVHRKLVEQVEEKVETQLNNAEKRVAAVRESGRQKLVQLKQIIVECLKDEQGSGL